ncbi:MAG: Amino-acid carrier protein AlsT [Candidatus Anoxychlamydiales bacterium]|nr:Amino-acid carrier protein AlsT [Candidatus Anoxychlamydiales bacterium]
MKNLIEIFEKIDFYLWNGFLIYLLLIVGVFLSIRLKGMQIKYLFTSLKFAFFRKDKNAKGDISQFQSLMTALAATIGIGSIAGMSTAVISGGFGAIFWMWVVAFIGMVTKYAEALLAVKYRVLDKNNQMAGGPMYYIHRGLNLKWLGSMFAVLGIFASFAGGNLIQSQSISDALFELAKIPHFITGIAIALFSAVVILGGIKSLGKVNAYLVPIMALIYVIGGLIIITINYNQILNGLFLIFKSAFSLKAAKGGLIGAGIQAAIQMGIARGISSNEAGLGSSPIAAAAAKTDVPGRQALISMSGVFLSSFIVCTITVLVLAVTNVVGMTTETGDLLNGAPLVMRAFASVLPFGGYIVAIGLILFGFSTILGWSYYGEKCFEFLFKEKYILFFRIAFILVVFLGAISSIKLVWPLADIMNGLMAFPNLIGLFLLTNVVVSESKAFFELLKNEKEIIKKRKSKKLELN